uniref:Uncharacterized protein n=1 Tax=Octopus bimaculoides TaxID=37653 RepID=A0A0L8HBK6_OCTBM
MYVCIYVPLFTLSSLRVTATLNILISNSTLDHKHFANPGIILIPPLVKITNTDVSNFTSLIHLQKYG